MRHDHKLAAERKARRMEKGIRIGTRSPQAAPGGRRLRRTWVRPKSYTRHSLKRDAEATAAAKFMDPKSFIDVLGREWRHGMDRVTWKQAIYERDKGICQLCHKAIQWFSDADGDHVIPLGKGGDWKVSNGRLVHGMLSLEGCHRKRHGRVLHWSRKAAGDA